jgi:AcrR family transcriptional regulator
MTTSATLPQPRTRPREILDAALRVFLREGYRAATIEQIRNESLASTGSIYHHFGGKEGIAAALYVEGLADYQRRFLETLERGKEPEATVKALVRGHLGWVAERPDLAAFLLTSRDAELRVATDDELRSMNRRVIDTTRRWIEASDVRPMSTRLLYAVVIGPAQEFARLWVRRQERSEMRDAERELPDAAWRAVAP